MVDLLYLCNNSLNQLQTMFCCSPQHLELSIAKNELDFQRDELYSKKFRQILASKGVKHQMPKFSALQIDSKFNYQFKIGHDKHSQLLFQSCDPSKQIYLTSINKRLHEQRLWRVLGDKESHELRLGDKIKIGLSELSVYSCKLFASQEKESVQFKTQYNCRYCFLNTYTHQDPLLNLCKCSGSVKYLHLDCLRNWLITKLQVQDRGHAILYTQLTKYFRFNKLECEICKTQWPKTVRVNKTLESLLQFQSNDSSSLQSFESYRRDSSPYVVFETHSLDQDDIQVNVFIKIYTQDPFYLGNSEDSSDLALQALGVSPIHCYLYTNNHRLYITDCGSMAGTLITMHQQQMFTNKKSLCLQYGQLIFTIGPQEPLFWCLTPQQQYKVKFRIQHQFKK